MFSATALDIVCGIEVNDPDHELAVVVKEAFEGSGQGHVPGAHWIEYFPIMKYIPSWMPGANFKKLGRKYRPVVETMVHEPYQWARDAVVRTLMF